MEKSNLLEGPTSISDIGLSKLNDIRHKFSCFTSCYLLRSVISKTDNNMPASVTSFHVVQRPRSH